ncbi:hypothetical protein PV326_008152 [Microctonus aethiopoides]|nr:hypothetical protein PV326_008152 [Microctonus aethiopoides]
MSNVGNNLEQQIASLQIDNGNNAIDPAKPAKKVGPAVPPKPKKSQPQVPQSYTIKPPSMPLYSTVLNNSGTNEKTTSLYANSPSPYVPPPSSAAVVSIGQTTNKNHGYTQTSTQQHQQESQNKFYHENNDNFYQNNEHLYTNELQDKFQPKHEYDKNFYSNITNVAAPQVPVDDRSSRATRNAVYSNIEPAIPIPVPAPITKEKEIIYSNIQWNNKPENTYCNISEAHNHEQNIRTVLT